jgi:hypothetical protein
MQRLAWGWQIFLMYSGQSGGQSIGRGERRERGEGRRRRPAVHGRQAATAAAGARGRWRGRKP